MTALGVVRLPAETAPVSEVRAALGDVVQKRSRLLSIAGRIVQRLRETKVELQEAKTTLRLRLDEMTANDPEVRARRAVEAAALARLKCKGHFDVVDEVSRRLERLEGVYEVCSFAERALESAKQSLHRMVQLVEADAYGAGARFGGRN